MSLWLTGAWRRSGIMARPDPAAIGGRGLVVSLSRYRYMLYVAIYTCIFICTNCN